MTTTTEGGMAAIDIFAPIPGATPDEAAAHRVRAVRVASSTLWGGPDGAKHAVDLSSPLGAMFGPVYFCGRSLDWDGDVPVDGVVTCRRCRAAIRRIRAQA